jgi:hypothetical protein
MGRGVKQLQALQVPDDLVSPRVHPGETAVIWLIPPNNYHTYWSWTPPVTQFPGTLCTCCSVARSRFSLLP